MACSRAVRVAFAAALLGSIGWGWYAGGRATAGTTYRATVVDTIDGDTIVVQFIDGARETVRLLGVDTPETHHPRKPVQCYGPDASAYTRPGCSAARSRWSATPSCATSTVACSRT